MLALRTPLVLASQSPRRRHLLAMLGLSFEVHAADLDEVFADVHPAEAVERLARDKAHAVAHHHPDALVLAADTTVVLETTTGLRILEKPADADSARAMLAALSGQTHTVYTGLALAHPASQRLVTAHEATRVTFAPLTPSEIDAYVATGSPMDKAGAYGIQDDHGALFVARIDGDYYNVVGLPLRRLYETLRTHFADLLAVA